MIEVHHFLHDQRTGNVSDYLTESGKNIWEIDNEEEKYFFGKKAELIHEVCMMLTFEV